MTVILPEAGAAPSGRYVVRAVDGHLANAVASSATNHGADSGVDATNSNANSGDHGATSRTAWISYERGVGVVVRYHGVAGSVWIERGRSDRLAGSFYLALDPIDEPGSPLPRDGGGGFVLGGVFDAPASAMERAP